MSKKVINSLVFTREEIANNVREQMEFLRLVHPSAVADGYKEGVIELRFLLRTDDGTKPQRSFNTWSLNEKDEEYLLKTMTERNGWACCTYFSGYAFKKANKFQTMITNVSSLYTQILPMDFDGMSEEGFIKEREILRSLGIETLDVSTGNGYQSFILLDEKCFDDDLYGRFTDLLRQKGFNVDQSIRDRARVLRMPLTYNCKQFGSDTLKYNPVNPQGLPTYIYNKTEKRYSLDWVFEQVESLPDVKKVPEGEGQLAEETEHMTELEFLTERLGYTNEPTQEEPIQPQEVEEEPKLKEEPKEEEPVVFVTGGTKEKPNVEIKPVSYTYLDLDKLPEAIQNILMGTPKAGVGNDCLLFLVQYLRNTIGLDIPKQIETLKTWGKLCTPVWDDAEIINETKRLNKYKFKAKFGKYTDTMKEMFGELVLEEWKIQDEIIIPNDIFDKYVKDMKDGSFRLYLALKLLHHEENKNSFTNDEIWERAYVSDRTFERNIGDLTEPGIVAKKRSRKDTGDKYQYYINPYESTYHGFVKVKSALIEIMLMKDLSDSQILFYLFMKRLIGNEGKTCHASQKYIAKQLGKKSHTTISKFTDDLHDKKFIRKKTEKIGNIKYTEYILLK